MRRNAVVRTLSGRPRGLGKGAVAAFAALLSVALVVAAIVAPHRATAAMTPFPAGAAVVYIAQNGPTQLYAATAQGSDLQFSAIGPVADATYNALAYNVNDRFLYATRTGAGQQALIRISSDGSYEVVSALAQGSLVGAFGSGAFSDRFYYYTANRLNWYDVATNASGSVATSAAFTASDMAWSNGYFWGMQISGGTATVTRMGTGGVVTTFPFSGLDGTRFGAGTPSSAFGGAWTYGNGNLGFTNNAGGTVQVSIAGAASANPTFTAVSYMSGPASTNNDAAASPGTPVDLAIAKSVDAPTKQIGDRVAYTLSVTNTTSNAVSSGFTITDVVPTYLTIDAASVPAHCAITGQQITCAEGTLAAGASLTRTFDAVVNTNASRGLTVVNAASVLGNEEDANASNNTASASFTVIAAGLTLLKTADYADANDNGNPDVGEAITWTFRVTNDGDIDATSVSVDDPTVGAITPANQDIAAGAFAVFTASGTVTQAHVNDGLVTNTAVANGMISGSPYETNPSTATIPVRAFPQLTAVKTHALIDANGNTVADEGETIDYTIRVTNVGNVTMTGVSVDDAMLGAVSPASVTLAPGAGQDFTGSHVVSAADVAAGSITNVATAKGTPPNGPEVITPPTTTTQEAVRTGITLVKSAVDPTAVATTVGQVIQYRFVVTNTGNTGLTDVVISDPMLDSVPAPVTIAAGQQAELFGDHVVTQDDIDTTVATGFFTNTATASGVPDGETTPIVSTPSSVNVPTVANPLLQLEKSFVLDDVNANGLADVGETIDYIVTARNAGNVTLENVTVTDAKFTPSTRTIGVLVPGASRSEAFTGYVVTQPDVDAGTVGNVATGTAEYPGGTPITPPPPATTTTPTGGAPLLHIVKRAVLNDANGNGVADAGETIQYTVDVWNRGEVSAHNVQVVDPKAGVFAPSGVVVNPGGPVRFTAAAPYVVTSADVLSGSVDNTAHATAQDPRTADPLRSNDSSTSTPTPAPELQIRKFASLADSNNNGLADVGEIITYSFLVSNNGNVAIDGISVIDAKVTGLTPSGFTLAPREAVSVSADPYVVTDADVIAGSVANSATASGTPVGGTLITTPPSTTSTPTVTGAATLSIVKTAVHDDTNDNGVADLGETILYTFDVTNTGTLTVTGVTVTDPKVAGIAPASADLMPQQTVTFSADPYTVTQADIDAGSVYNQATADGTDPGGNPVVPPTDDSTVPTPTRAPAMTAAKVGVLTDANGNGVADEGETITYTVTLTNTGNTTLTNVFPVDAKVTGFTPSAGVTLVPGASQAFIANAYTVTAADVAAGSVVNTATGTGTPPTGGTTTTPPATDEIPTFDPGMLLDKSAALADSNGNGMADLGEVITYTFTVSNTGNVPLENVSIVDPRVSSVAPVTATIAVNSSAVFTAAYTVTEADILAQALSNTATATGNTPGDPTPILTPPDTATVPPAPIDSRLDIVKSASLADANGNGYADEGESIQYSFVVTNPGNLTHTNVVVNDPRVTGLTPATIATLAPGASVTVSANPYVVTAADVAAGGVTNVATASGTDSRGTPVVSPESSTHVASPPLAALSFNGVEGVGAWIATGGAALLLGLLLLALHRGRVRTTA